MITIIISGPQGCGKTKIKEMIAESMSKAGFVSFKVLTTNQGVKVLHEEESLGSHMLGRD